MLERTLSVTCVDVDEVKGSSMEGADNIEGSSREGSNEIKGPL